MQREAITVVTKSKHPAPSVSKCRICGIKTHDPEGVCVVCRIKKRIEDRCRRKFGEDYRE